MEAILSVSARPVALTSVLTDISVIPSIAPADVKVDASFAAALLVTT